MPVLPISGSSALDGGHLHVVTNAEILELLPPEVRNSASAPVRDALAAALREILKAYQRRARRAAALSDILRSSGAYLSGLARDHEVYQQPGELDSALRARILGTEDLVTPAAVLGAVNAILAPHTDVAAKYFESELDQWFVSDGTASWDSFVYDGTAGATPYYQDRLYVDDTDENDGYSRDTVEVLDAWVNADNYGRYFVFRIPPLEAVDDEGAYALDATTPEAEDAMLFIADGTDTSGAESDGSVTTFFYTDQVQSDELYAAIVSAVELIKGQGMRWQALVDPLLS